MIISRQKLLEAAMQVFAEFGFRGATTRRIADAAGVNEVTLFRHFKSKTALINAAAQLHAQRQTDFALPDVPDKAEKELAEWCASQLRFLQSSRALIRKCMAELEEHPEMADCMRHGPIRARMQLREYATALCRARGVKLADDQIAVACALLHGALFADSMGRDMMPEMYPQPANRAPTRYAAAFLRSLGLAEPVTTKTAAHTNGNGHRPKRRAARS